MKVLVLGATGATGSLVVQQLLNKKIETKIIVRGTQKISKDLLNNKLLECIVGSISEFEQSKYLELISGCDSVISCLGHNVSFKGILGPPYKLVSNAVEKIVKAALLNNQKLKILLMSTTAFTNKKDGEQNTNGEKVIFSLLELLLPPHRDNILAGNYLLNKIENNSNIDWTAVRPDSLFNEEMVSAYEVVNNKTRSPIFDPGKTSRINVAHFMAELLVNENLWNKWQFKMPVIYNKH